LSVRRQRRYRPKRLDLAISLGNKLFRRVQIDARGLEGSMADLFLDHWQGQSVIMDMMHHMTVTTMPSSA